MSAILPIPRRWDSRQIGDLAGRNYLVTGGNSGLGFETVKALAGHGARVYLAGRDEAKVASALAKIKGDVEPVIFDIALLSSVKEFVASFSGDHLDGLVLNAGVMNTPLRHTGDGFELQMATNHLGHFALAGLLLNKLSGARIVSVSSMAHRMADMDPLRLKEQIFLQGDDASNYSGWRTYGRTKLANLLFTHELQRRSDAAGWNVTALAAHPGWSNTNLQAVAPSMKGRSLEVSMTSLANKSFAQSAAMGALPTLAALCLPGLPGGTYIGPDGWGEMRGYPKLVRARDLAYDQPLAAALWGVSEEVTALRWQVLFDSDE